MSGNSYGSRGWAGLVTLFSVVFIFLGIAFLMQNFKLAPAGFWGILWRFWPILLILIGLNILLGSSRPLLLGGLTAIAMFAILGLSTYISWTKATEKPAVNTIAESLRGIQKADVEILFGAGDLKLDGIVSQPDNLVEATVEHRGAGTGVQKEYSRIDEVGKLKLTVDRDVKRLLAEKKDSWKLHFSPALPLNIILKSDLSELDLNISSLKVEKLELHIGTSNLRLQMPNSGSSRARVKSGATNIDITIPQDKAARIKIDGILSSLDIDEKRFPLVDKYYISPQFESTLNRVEIEIESSLSRVKIK